MRTNNHPTTQEFFNFQENIVPGLDERMEAELRPVSARIPLESYKTLEYFAERWGFTKSSLAAQVLETALGELDLLDRAREHKEAQKAAL
jgi:predicted DNA-binding protein